MTSENDFRSSVHPVERQELAKRLNELERVVPIYRQALETIANAEASGAWGRTADRALREALRGGQSETSTNRRDK
jgi:hypothetical protein